MKLKELLDYELRSSSRYQRYMSVVVIVSEDKHIIKKIGENVRQSDESFVYHDSLAVLMGETDLTGSLKAIDRYQQSSNGSEMRFAVASYPSDGSSTQDMLEALLRRFNMARMAHTGSVIANG